MYQFPTEYNDDILSAMKVSQVVDNALAALEFAKADGCSMQELELVCFLIFSMNKFPAATILV